MRLRWLVFPLGSETHATHAAAIVPYATTPPLGHAQVLQVWVPGWGLERLDGEHGTWEDIPVEWK